MSDSSLFSFFSFKNKETEKEILKVISQNEGVLFEKLENYLNYVHSKKNAELFLEAKTFINAFWRKNKHLCLSEVVGLFDNAMMDIKLEVFREGENFVKIMKEELKEKKKRRQL